MGLSMCCNVAGEHQLSQLLPGHHLSQSEIDYNKTAAHFPADTEAAALPLGKFADQGQDRKSTRLNSSHVAISYAVFCLKKKMYCNYNPERFLLNSRKTKIPLPITPTVQMTSMSYGKIKILRTISHDSTNDAPSSARCTK